MSLSSLLLASGPKKIDKELDDLFKSNPVPPRKQATPIQVPTQGSAPPAKKRKIEAAILDPPTNEKKRAKATTPAKPAKGAPKAAKSPASTKKSKGKEAAVEVESDQDSEGASEEEDEDNSDLENAYLGKKGSMAKPSANVDDDGSEGEGEGSGDSDSDPDAPPPVHESLTKRVRTKPTKKTKIIPEGETSVQRDARTLFIGGLPMDVAQKKPLQKQLCRHILSFLPSTSKVKIESTRLRSVAFRDPTSSTALSSAANPTPAPAVNVNANSVPIPGSSNHSKSRASTWRQSSAADAKTQAAADGDAAKEYLTPAQKKKILFIQGAFHPEANGVNAYVVLAHHTDDAADADTPYAAAQLIAHAANASMFMERTLRVDVCGRLPDSDGGPSGDPKLSIFIGNLDFASREGDVRDFFEGVVAAERGPAPAASEADSTGRWVQNVRLIRDRETQLGKGFGYVRFSDRECVDEILALAKTDEGKLKLKFAKRTLRVQRCRAGAASASTAKAAGVVSKSTFPAAPPKRGDPTLGARLAHLDKDARKAAKKADADRVDRRAEKKKMGTRMRVNDKIKVAAGGSGRRVGGGFKGGKDKSKGKDRERDRKTRVSENVGGRRGKK
ncbi:hypothetical protein B0H15DRAFT_543104 [Mycena belliarum]|uniref:Nucleolar protein 12 n=1 Tax=Mycena belliarum TaxID=1033014 RepID=A0AAD6UHK4_9AGAR|nr:hypothetical protein B0H15DRAFT_543104 [Mycena belliae]